MFALFVFLNTMFCMLALLVFLALVLLLHKYKGIFLQYNVASPLWFVYVTRIIYISHLSSLYVVALLPLLLSGINYYRLINNYRMESPFSREFISFVGSNFEFADNIVGLMGPFILTSVLGTIFIIIISRAYKLSLSRWWFLLLSLDILALVLFLRWIIMDLVSRF
jgi:hypothetical protein